MSKIKWLDRRIAHPGPYLTLCTSESEYLAAMRGLGIKPIDDWIKTEHADATVHHATSKDGQQASVVCIRVSENRTAVEIAGLLVHEAVHIWQRYCECIGEHTPGAEQEAYAIQSISQELMAAYADRL
jgi:hypothetical protein